MRSFIVSLAIFSVVSSRFLADEEPEAEAAAWVADPACADFKVARTK